MLGFIPSLGLAVVLLIGGRQVIDGGLSLGDFTAFYTYLMMLIGPMRMLGDGARDGPARGRLGQPAVRDPRPRAADRPARRTPPPLPARAGRGRASAASALRYDGAEPALADVDLEVEAGRTVALVGPTGSGKTSLVALIARLYDPTEGAVLVDGADLRTVDVRSLRAQIAFVADDSFLFSATVAENIAYARPDATREQIELAARRAQAHDVHRAAARTATRRWSASAG